MKAITFAFSAFFVLFITSCSDLEQSTSPIIPDANQISKTQDGIDGAYDYLQCFCSVPVASVNSSRSINSIEIVISPDNFPKFFMHMFAVIEYKDFGLPLKDQLIFIGRPQTNVIVLNNFSIRNIESVKVYAYIPGNNGHSINQPYDYLTVFKELKIETWSDQQGEIKIITGEWLPNLSDTFIELEILHPSQDRSSYVLTYISHPENGKITIPKFLKESISDIKMFGHFTEAIQD